MAMASKSRVKPLGKNPDASGSISENVGMETYFGLGNDEHSPQFDFNIQNNVMNFYIELGDGLGVK